MVAVRWLCGISSASVSEMPPWVASQRMTASQ